MHNKHKDLTPGFYHITSEQEAEPCLVHVYQCSDLGGQLVVGFNIHDGGGLVTHGDLLEDCTLTPVLIVENTGLISS